MKRVLLVFILSVSVISLLSAQDFTKILKELDNLNNFEKSDFTAVYTIITQKPGEKDSVLQARVFRRDREDLFLILILQPEANKGQGYLKDKDNVWFYDPSSRQFTFSSLKENISNSEAKNSDLTRATYSDSYTIEKTEEGVLGKIPVWIISLKAKTTDAVYDRLKIYVRKDRTMLLKEEAYSVSGRLMRTTLIPKYVELNGKLLPSQIIIVDELNPGEKSQITLTEQSVSPIPDSVFKKDFLERVNK
ncbi:MAG TPA: outer membrane lipoprotein-sorting protein [Spirochaetales bacterium]|nr:outer membrane lipoprotein-sorting protein [Spirochaetales bacterium]HQG39994.1 outer membrane lipoprotein-sorting protein [Spirochaetales bacterium]HQK34906.1 outer membrane lipoprotein-sorting protein [Spirochaetales bacterium]